MYLSSGAFQLTGSGTLFGPLGWYGVETELSLNGSDTAIDNLAVISNGIVDGAANLTVNNAFVSAGGKFAGPDTSTVTTTGAGFVVAGAQKVGTGFSGRWASNKGIYTVESGDMKFVVGAGIKNLQGAELIFEASSSVFDGDSPLAPLAELRNDGSIKVLAGDTNTIIGIHVENNKTGNIDISGKLNLYSLEQVSDGGKITLSNALQSTLRVGDFKLTSGSVTGAGLVSIECVDGVTPGYFEWELGASIEGGQNSDLELDISPGARGSIINLPTLTSAKMFNYGTVTIIDGFDLDKSTLRNQPSGTLEIISSGVANPSLSGAGNELLVNSGTIIIGWSKYYQTDLPNVVTNLEIQMEQRGTINVRQGQLFIWKNTWNYGSYLTNVQQGGISPSTSVIFTSIGVAPTTHRFLQNIVCEGPGKIRAQDGAILQTVSSAVVRISSRFEMADAATRLEGILAMGTFSASEFVWYGGTFAANVTVEVEGSDLFDILELEGDQPAERTIDGGNLKSSGTVAWTSAGNVVMKSGASWRVEGGTVELSATAGGVIKNPALGQGMNDSTIEIVAGTWSGQLLMNPAPAFHPIQVPFKNAGGQVQLNGFHFQAGFVQNSGNSVLGDGLAKITGALNATGGIFDVGSGFLSVIGSMILAPGATLAVTISELSGGGWIEISGNASLDGTLSITLAYAPNPPLGTRFTIFIVNGTLQGAFATFSGMQFQNGGDYLAPDLSDPHRYDLVVHGD